MLTAGEKKGGAKLFRLIIIALMFMAITLVYVWFRISITKIDYRIAEEVHRGDSLLEENRKLKVETATLRSPHRVESIARTKLGMGYPERDQVIFLK
ncbi:MAG: cell division protein FtsL [Thermodesulfobacteriota bacterium]|nr:cell division protein FtsL [Thermodesulfobacteriota bacterium]